MDSAAKTPLGRYLEENKLTQDAFAARVGCSQAAVARYVAGLRLPERDVMLRIVEATGGALTPNDFFGLGESNAA